MSVRAVVNWLDERGDERQACVAGPHPAAIQPVVATKVSAAMMVGASQIRVVLSDEARTIATYRVRGS